MAEGIMVKVIGLKGREYKILLDPKSFAGEPARVTRL
jgi:hypothetical protein